ncbi:MAG: hypothetical protein ABEI98_01455 [Halorhabdus sp.]
MIHVVVPESIKVALASNTETFNPIRLWTAAFVHWSPSHLYGNVSGFLVATGIAWYLCTLGEKRRWFRMTFLSLLAVIPILVSLAVYVVTVVLRGETYLCRGFSGVVAGFVAFGFVALVALCVQTYSRRTGRAVAGTIGILLIWEVVWLSTDGGSVGLTALTVTGSTVCVADILRNGERPVSRDGWVDRIVSTAFVVSMFLALALLVGSLCSIPSTACPLIGRFAHAVGFVGGGTLAGFTYRRQ